MAAVFSFHDRWLIPASADAVFAALGDPDRYPDWWSNIVAAQRLDQDSGLLVCRSLLPYTLRMTVRREVVDPGTGTLRVGLLGDLVGWSSWRVVPVPGTDGQQTLADFRQEVTAPGVPGGSWKALRPILDANHRVMMWRGRRGLIAFLAGPQGGSVVSIQTVLGPVTTRIDTTGGGFPAVPPGLGRTRLN